MKYWFALLCVTQLCVILCGAAQAQSGFGSSTPSTVFCDRTRQHSAAEQDHLLRFAAAVRDALDAFGKDTVIISRSGLDLSRFQIRYSHAAIMGRNDAGSWTARQLYYACDEGHPRIFDQGLAGFVGGSDNPSLGYISIVGMPSDQAKALQQATQDGPRALGLLAATYSANAYPFSTRYQNCNQWVMELLAIAWGNLSDEGDPRARAQNWLKEANYDPQPVKVGSGLLMIAAAVTPLLHLSDHPRDEIHTMQLKVSLPASIETFVKTRLPDSEHLELCHNDRQIVVHHGWEPIAEGCRPGAGDQVLVFE